MHFFEVDIGLRYIHYKPGGSDILFAILASAGLNGKKIKRTTGLYAAINCGRSFSENVKLNLSDFPTSPLSDFFLT